MDLLFKREQTPGRLARVQFKLWSKIELDEEEQALVSRYKFDEAVLIAALEPGLFRRAAVVALVSTLVALALLFRWGDGPSPFLPVRTSEKTILRPLLAPLLSLAVQWTYKATSGSPPSST